MHKTVALSCSDMCMNTMYIGSVVLDTAGVFLQDPEVTADEGETPKTDNTFSPRASTRMEEGGQPRATPISPGTLRFAAHLGLALVALGLLPNPHDTAARSRFHASQVGGGKG
jgi:hypothetical protein